MVQVTPIDENLFKVTVEGSPSTTHEVTVADEYHLKLTGGKIDKTELVHRSFKFLLKREPNTMIMKTFNLTVIESYFPEYPTEISKSVH
ncbi:MAG: hypothetical protein GVY19_10045 [Bacteroidetes bacterium]|jgi:hypothetical protein|nr:hypothetical protein [Bacteroidota bacterium]